MDLIDREQTINLFLKEGMVSAAVYVYYMPPAEKTGKWVKEIDRTFHWHCSNCGYVIGVVKMDCNYCPNCGARMENDEH